MTGWISLVWRVCSTAHLIISDMEWVIGQLTTLASYYQQSGMCIPKDLLHNLLAVAEFDAADTDSAVVSLIDSTLVRSHLLLVYVGRSQTLDGSLD